MGKKKPSNQPVDEAVHYWAERYDIAPADTSFIRESTRRLMNWVMREAHEEVQTARRSALGASMTPERQRAAFLALVEKKYKRARAKPDVWGNLPDDE